MRAVTNLMINDYGLKKLHTDMMGYKVVRNNDYSFHHLIIPHRDCARKRIPSDGYVDWNGAILSSRTSHPYIHVIERFDRKMFEDITNELVEINKQGYVDREHLLRIYDMLDDFEHEFGKEHTKKGKKIIKPEFVAERMDLYDPLNCEKLENVKRLVLTKR